MDGNEAQREQDRLAGVYRQMADGELLVLEESAGDLTEVAQAALRAELKHRGLKIPEKLPELQDLSMGVSEEATEWRTLHVFSQTFEARAAIAILERDGIEFAVEDRTIDEAGELRAGPAVQLALMVIGADWDRAVAVLRRDAGLFPEAVVDPRGPATDAAEPSRSVVAEFGSDEELAEAKLALRESAVRFEVIRDADEIGPGGSIEVAEADVDRALSVLERLIAEERQ